MSRLIITLILACAAPAQTPSFMQIGQIVHGYGGGSVALLDVALQTTTPLQVVPSGLACNAFTWDPQSPDDLVTWASDGHIYRATVTGAGVSISQLSQQPLAGTSGVVQMSWDANGDLITVGAALNSQILKIDRVSGAVTSLLSWPFPQTPRCGGVDPSTGDHYIGNAAGIYRVSGVQAGSPSVNLIYASTGTVDSLAFDPLSPEFIVFVESGALRRVDKNTAASATLRAAPPFFDYVRQDEQGSFIATDGRDVYRFGNPANIPAGGVVPLLIGTNAVVGCCTGSDAVVVGATPSPFRLDVTPQAGGGAQLDVLNPPAGTVESWMFVSRTTFLPPGGGPFLGIVPDAYTFFLMTTFALPQPGNFLHTLGPPSPSVTLPAGTLVPFIGETWDAVIATLGPGGFFLGRTNVARVTWL